MQRRQSYIALILLGFFLAAHSHDWVPHHHHSQEEHHRQSESGSNGHEHEHPGLISFLSGLWHHHSHVPYERQAEMNPETTVHKAPSRHLFQLVPGLMPDLPGLADLAGRRIDLPGTQAAMASCYHAERILGRAPPLRA